MDILLTTIIKRPYVFLFLLGFLYLAVRHIGLARTILWLVTGYLIAFASEYSSVHNGFPYGEYHYIYENLRGELLLAGVPVWDSVSYSFMTYAGFAAADYALPKAKLWKIWLLGALLTTIMDIITDPVAKMGKQWFLGEIYYYAHDGWYFGVPWTNFAGWFLVALAIIGVNIICHREEPERRRGDPVNSTGLTGLLRRFTPRNDSANILHLAFYSSICIFNTVIAFYIGAYSLGGVNLLITIVTVSGLIKLRQHVIPAKAGI